MLMNSLRSFFPGLAPAGADRIGPECRHFFLGAAEGKGQFCGCDARDIPGCGAELQPAGGILFLLLLSPGGRCGRGRPAWSLMVRLFPGCPFLGGWSAEAFWAMAVPAGAVKVREKRTAKMTPILKRMEAGVSLTRDAARAAV